MKKILVLLLISCLYSGASFSGVRVTLKGSSVAIMESFHKAEADDYTFLSSESQVGRFVDKGYLVDLGASKHYAVKHDVQFAVVRPEVRLFIQRFSEQMFADCNEILVVTSALRLTTRQLRNSSKYSVHPTGMAIDLRVPVNNTNCKEFIEGTLLLLERRGVLQATKERWPPHYHVVVYPKQYGAYVARMLNKDIPEYEIVSGDNLYDIAKRYGTSSQELIIINNIKDPSKIWPGQKIRLR